MEFLKKHGALLLSGALIAIVFFRIGVHSGMNRIPGLTTEVTNATSGEVAVDFAPFWKAWNVLNEKYVPASTTATVVTNQEKVWGAIEGLASSLHDPYTVFFPPVENEMFETDIRGNFEGIGAEVLAQDGAITVIAPLKDSPAARAGLLSGDRIIKIDGKDTSSLTTEDAVKIIRGEAGTSVTLTIFRSGIKAPFEVKVPREVVNIPTINTKSLPGGIFDIELYSFSEQSPNLFRGALREFINSGDKKLILDLRGNPGGYLEAAIDMASWFLPSSKVVVREDFGPGKDQTSYRSRGYDIFNDNLPFIILVDKGSASAAEILAGALAEHGKAILVGETTFGKGSVQELVDITSDTSLKVTVARWLTPNGVSISEKGIEPQYKVERTIEDMKAGRDPQLDKALEILRAK
ncbi:S41 family peptidase [Candidatus Parcubacteria bacterium]|nr:S41 family peptidase [Candidatus Parcubacteria bacterium]